MRPVYICFYTRLELLGFCMRTCGSSASFKSCFKGLCKEALDHLNLRTMHSETSGKSAEMCFWQYVIMLQCCYASVPCSCRALLGRKLPTTSRPAWTSRLLVTRLARRTSSPGSQIRAPPCPRAARPGLAPEPPGNPWSRLASFFMSQGTRKASRTHTALSA